MPRKAGPPLLDAFINRSSADLEAAMSIENGLTTVRRLLPPEAPRRARRRVALG
jgi:hypothetical protein